MASLIANRDHYQIATGNDADSDRHGIVTPDAGLMNPNHYLAVAIDYLYTHRPSWPAGVAVGKTAVSSSIIDRVVGRHRPQADRGAGRVQVVRRRVDRRHHRLRRRGVGRVRRSCAATDRCGPPTRTASSWRCWPPRSWPSPARRRRSAIRSWPTKYGAPTYARIDAPADREQKARLAKLSPEQVTATELAGEPITAKLTTAPGNGAPLGGLKVTTANALVRRAAVGHRGRLQDLRRIVQRARASGGGAKDGPGSGQPGHRLRAAASHEPHQPLRATLVDSGMRYRG